MTAKKNSRKTKGQKAASIEDKVKAQADKILRSMLSSGVNPQKVVAEREAEMKAFLTAYPQGADSRGLNAQGSAADKEAAKALFEKMAAAHQSGQHPLSGFDAETRSSFEMLAGSQAKTMANFNNNAAAGKDSDDHAHGPSMLFGVPHIVDKENPRGIDIFSLLLSKRKIFVDSGVGPELASIIGASLMYLGAIGKDGKWLGENEKAPPIEMYVNSPGGSVVDGLAIVDIMRDISADITTIGVGYQASMGSVIMAAGDTRMMMPHAYLMIHQGSTRTGGQPTDVFIGADFMARLGDRCNQVYVDNIGLTREYWKVVLNRDTWFTAAQALEIGYIDAISEGRKKPGRYVDTPTLKTAFAKGKEDNWGIYKMTAEELLMAINSDGADGGDGVWAMLRPELAVAMARFPRFWTEPKQREYAAKNNIALEADMDQKEIAAFLTEHLGLPTEEARIAAVANDNKRKRNKPSAGAQPKAN